ncbi:Protein transport protein sec20 [Emydomyces testavorans]|uniref:Protein transport protein sec20 n=1 Tax=Emydomyces testavorans TaxID=2070801 RepID=A0AAF0DNG1_9EURO|nr:Protein transport protein sec20 [Emydomyces testavorans]
MTSSGLQHRLSSLSTAHKQTTLLIQRLQNWSTTPGQGDEARVELGAEIHLRLKEMEDEMELLRVETEQLEAGGSRKREDEDKEAERERIVTMIRKLEADAKNHGKSASSLTFMRLHSARTRFRKAQMQAKRNAEIAKQKERQLLFSGVAEDDVPRRKASLKLTHDDLVVNASNDVTAALRRTHQLMQSELSRSQFAQQTLEQSTAALNTLSESYSNLDTLLSSSRSLVSSLLRSQKSDTWYLETAFYILVGTIIWLLFRRIFYGPLWWLLWLPLKTVYKSTFAIWGIVGLSGGAQKAAVSVEHSYSSALPTTSMATIIPGTTAPAGTVFSSGSQSATQTLRAESESILEQVGKMVDERETEERQRSNNDATNVDDISPEERKRQEEMPRNPKKRMWEEDIDETAKRDEL